MGGQPDPPNWADIAAVRASIIGIAVTIGLHVWTQWAARRHRLQTHARRHNGSMCTLDVEYDAMTTAGSFQLEVMAIWPPKLFLLPDTRAVKLNPLGEKTVDGAFMGRTGAVTARMTQSGTIYSAGAEVWRLKDWRAAILLVRIRNRSTQQVAAQRLIRIRPML